MKILNWTIKFSFITILFGISLAGYACLSPQQNPLEALFMEPATIPGDSTENKKKAKKDITPSPNKIKDRTGDFINNESKDPYYLPDPKNVVKTIEYDAKSNMYLVTEKIGNSYYRPPTYMTYEEYMNYSLKQSNEYYWKERSNALNLIEPKVAIGNSKDGITNPMKWEKPPAESFFGPGGVEIRPQGNVEVLLGGNHSYIDNPILTEIQKSQGGLDFDMQINLSVTAKIGDKISTTLKYNNGINFGVDAQRIKLGYTGKEDNG